MLTLGALAFLVVGAAAGYVLGRTSAEGDIVDRGGYQPRAVGPPPTQPPPKRGDALRSATPGCDVRFELSLVERRAGLAVETLRVIAEDDPRIFSDVAPNAGWSAYRRVRGLARDFLHNHESGDAV